MAVVNIIVVFLLIAWSLYMLLSEYKRSLLDDYTLKTCRDIAVHARPAFSHLCSVVEERWHLNLYERIYLRIVDWLWMQLDWVMSQWFLEKQYVQLVVILAIVGSIWKFAEYMARRAEVNAEVQKSAAHEHTSMTMHTGNMQLFRELLEKMQHQRSVQPRRRSGPRPPTITAAPATTMPLVELTSSDDSDTIQA